MAKKLFDLPQTPIDKYKIEYFRVETHNGTPYVDHVEAVYYINTPYETLNPTFKGGAPIKDDWMMYVNGSCTGRFTQWEMMGRKAEMFDNCFLTRKEALDRAIDLLQADIAYHTRMIQASNKALENLMRQIAGKK